MAVVITQVGAQIGVGKYIRASIYTWNLNQLGILNFSCWCESSVGGGVSAGQAASAFQTLFGPLLQPGLTLGTKLLGTKVSFYAPNNHLGSGIATDTIVGTSGPDALPTQTRGLISMSTGMAGQAFRGRMYPPFPAVTNSAPITGLPNAAYVAQLQLIANQLVLGFPLVSGGLTSNLFTVVFHRKAGKGGIPAAQTGDLVISAVAKPLFATQRRSGDEGRINPPIIS